MTIRAALRQARLDQGLTVEEAADRAGYRGKSGWAMVENGHNTPGWRQMVKMAKAVNKPVHEVFPELAAIVVTGEEAAGDG